MKDPLISVVMINYNAGPLLRLAIESVLAQSHEHLELIIVDDASKDDGPDVIRAFAASDRRVCPVLSEMNRGISASRNAGIREATGEYIAILDGDDLYLPDTLERHLESFLRMKGKEPQLCFQASDAWLINEDGKRGGRYMPAEYWGGDRLGDDVPRWTLPSSWFFPRAVPVRLHDGYRLSDATIFIARMAAFGVLGYVGEPLFEYRLRISSATNQRAAEVVRDLNASALSIQQGRLDDPVPSESIPKPPLRQVLAWKYGRNAKAAMLNGRKLRAFRDLAVAGAADPMLTLRKLKYFYSRHTGGAGGP